MADDYMLAEDAVSADSGRFEKFLKVFIVLAGLFLAGELIWLLGISPFRPFSRIDITGDITGTFSRAGGGGILSDGAAAGSAFAGLSREKIFTSAGIGAGSSYFSTDVRAMEQSLMKLSVLESVRVFKHFPDKLQIVVELRRPVASCLVSLDGRTVPVVFDSQGVVFDTGGEQTEESLSRQLPVISGIVIENPSPGMRLPIMFTPLFKELEKIQISAPELLTAVSEIKINRKAFDSFDLILYPVHRKVKVQIPELNEDLLRYTILMVDVLASRESGTETLDFRSGIASYIPKEASSE